jgi:transient receptor potential cation channel subfamily V protein 5
MVKLLLDYGADLHQRCTGRFFSPDDQKTKIRNVAGLEHPEYLVETSYQGFLYYGEYPLTYAAILNQIDIVKQLLYRDAQIDARESNGNTVCHMLVINNNLVSFLFHLLPFTFIRLIVKLFFN